jgi:hypothetical protein
VVGRELVSLVVAFISVLHELAEPTLLKVSVVLCLDGFHLALNCGINFILEGSLIAAIFLFRLVGKSRALGCRSRRVSLSKACST